MRKCGVRAIIKFIDVWENGAPQMSSRSRFIPTQVFS